MKIKSIKYRSSGKIAPRFVAAFDSSTGMVKALSHALEGKDFSGTGLAPSSIVWGKLINRLPETVRQKIYIASALLESIPAKSVEKIRSEELAKWVTAMYPRRRYPAIFIGSSNGAMIHLAAALGAPWLPQTFMIPVHHPPSISVDDPKSAVKWAAPFGEALLKNNPNIELHHMFDPNQDRLMLQKITYFRIKYLRLPLDYQRFIARQLEPGGTVILVNCTRQWPTTRVDKRHIFQFGGMGGATESDLFSNTEKARNFLKKSGSHFRQWDPPVPDALRPEAEWGFAPPLENDVREFTGKQGYHLKKLTFDEPEHLSPLTADLYRHWYDERGLPSNRLVAESFIMLEPHWMIRTGSVPFWMKFNMRRSLEWLEQYLEKSPPFDEIFIMLFSHGVESIGLPPFERWRKVLSYARKKGSFISTEPSFPKDLGTFMKYSKAFQRRIPSRYSQDTLSLEKLEKWIKDNAEGLAKLENL